MSSESLHQVFTLTCNAIYRIFGPIHLTRKPAGMEMEEIVNGYKEKGFLRYISSVDCMHLIGKTAARCTRSSIELLRKGNWEQSVLRRG